MRSTEFMHPTLTIRLNLRHSHAMFYMWAEQFGRDGSVGEIFWKATIISNMIVIEHTYPSDYNLDRFERFS